MSKKSKRKKLERQERQRGLLHEFDDQEQDHYEEKKLGDKWFIKQWNGGTERWQVAIYSEESYRKYKTFNRETKERDLKWIV